MRMFLTGPWIFLFIVLLFVIVYAWISIRKADKAKAVIKTLTAEMKTNRLIKLKNFIQILPPEFIRVFTSAAENAQICQQKYDTGKLVPNAYWISIFDHDNEEHSVDDQPAAILVVDSQIEKMIWFKHGKRHRGNDLPAVIVNDLKEWYRDGKQYE